MIKHIAVFVGALALVPSSAFADDGAQGDKKRPKAVPTMKDKQRVVDAATKPGAGGEALGSRGPPRPGKNWEDMTPAEKDAAQKRWLLNSGDFGTPGGAPKAAPKSVPPGL